MSIKGSIYLATGAALILLSGVFAIRNKRHLNRLESVGLVTGIVFGAIGAITFLLGNDFVIPFLWRGVILIVGIIIIPASLFAHRIPSIQLQPQAQPSLKPETQKISTPALKYGKPIVRKTKLPAHSGIYHTSKYFIEVVNATTNTVAKNCKGSITISGSEITNQATVWEKNNDYGIDIAHREFLYLFKVSIFRDKTGKEESRLYFSHPLAVDLVDEAAMESYSDNLDKSLSTLVQSDNASFPSEVESFNKTIHQIISGAVEE